jgi:hypothetical protein
MQRLQGSQDTRIFGAALTMNIQEDTLPIQGIAFGLLKLSAIAIIFFGIISTFLGHVQTVGLQVIYLLLIVNKHRHHENHHLLKNTLQRFRTFFPEHKAKQLYGILASVDLSDKLRAKILQEGIYVARIYDQVFELNIPENFHPQTY